MCDLTCTLKEMVVINVSKADDADDDLRARQYSVPSELIEDIDGKKFLCLTRKEVRAQAPHFASQIAWQYQQC